MQYARLGVFVAGGLALFAHGCASGADTGPRDDSASGTGGSSGSGNGVGGSGSGAGSTSATGGTGAGGASGGGVSNTGGSTAPGGSGAGGTSSTGGSGAGGSSGTGGTGGVSRDAGSDGSVARDTAPQGPVDGGAAFSFFYTSLDAVRRLSGSQNGFGGDLRFGEATGLAGADKICQTIAAGVGAGNKQWRAFLSVVKGPDGQPVHAIDRIGNGPWYTRTGRLIAMNRAGLLTGQRPAGDMQAVNDLPDETGQGTKRLGDTHDVITGSNAMGQLRYPGSLASTCMDWTATTAKGVTVGLGHAWPANSGMHWIAVHNASSCAAGVNVMQTGAGDGSSIGAGGGYGGIYCFALQP